MWTTFAAAVGASAAGLTGLTFIVVAFRFDVIATSQEYRNRAAQALSLFLTVTVTAALITVPQPTRALGAELLIAAAGSATLLRVLDTAARRGSTTRTRAVLSIALTLFVTGLAMSGLICLLGRESGLYFYVGSAILGLTWGVYGAWIFLTQAALESAQTGR